MALDSPVMNGGRPIAGAGSPARREGEVPEAGSTVIVALDLMAHWWSRPIAGEVATWLQAAEIESDIRDRISPATGGGVGRLPVSRGEAPALLEEYERLFVGPGHVSCPPYESFWREDVPVDIRRSLMGPCTADLRRLYGELEIELAPANGELPDHVAVELEALAYALSFEETLPVAHALFLEHLRQWLPRLCRAVAHEAQHSFYRELSGLSLQWLSYIQDYFASLGEAQPGTP
ncbi:MAG: molecular chaperone [Acidimicrobiales bacterium]